jgi:hypothetical protein
MLDGHAHVLDEHIGAFDQLEKGRMTVRLFEIERHHALIAMQVLIVGSIAPSDHFFRGIIGRLHSNDVRAPIGKVAHARRSCASQRQVKNEKTGQRQIGVRLAHHRPRNSGLRFAMNASRPSR